MRCASCRLQSTLARSLWRCPASCLGLTRLPQAAGSSVAAWGPWVPCQSSGLPAKVRSCIRAPSALTIGWVRLNCQLINSTHAVSDCPEVVFLSADIVVRDTVRWAGIQRLDVLGRSGHFGAGADLAHAMCDGWAASVAVIKCDVAFSEDTAAVFSRNHSKGKPALHEHLADVWDPSALCELTI